MAREYVIRFSDTTWLDCHRERLLAILSSFPSYIGSGSSCDVLLKDPSSVSSWAFDVRIFFQDDGSLLIEVSSRTPAFLRDVKALYEILAADADVWLEDADDPQQELDPAGIFPVR